MYSNEPVHILQVIGSMNRGGAETMVMNLYRNIDRTKVQFDFLLHDTKPGVFDEEIRSRGGELYYIKKFKGYDPIRYYRDCNKFFSEHPEIKVVHGHIGSCAAMYLKAAKKHGCFTIAHSHSANISRTLHDALFYISSYPTRYISDWFFGCSEKAGIARFGKKCVAGSKYENFHNAIDLNEYRFNDAIRTSIRKELHIDNNQLVFGTVGRLTRAKNPDYIYSIFSEILYMNQNAVCVWVGGGELEPYIKQLVSNSRYSDRLIMTGARSDVSKLLMGFDCFIFPSLWEGLPVSVVEAQQSGLPCLVSNNVTKEVDVSDLLTFMSVDIDPKEWAQKAIYEASSNINKRESPTEMIEKAGYDIRKTAEYLTDFYIDKASERK